ncbi:MAG: thioesterase family protein [Pseudomonadota bacterium]
MDAAHPALVWSQALAIEPEWVDLNNHLNMAYYHVLFDRTVDVGLNALDFGDAYRERENASIFNVETHVVYRREVSLDDRVRVSFHLLGRDQKRLHVYQTMLGADGAPAAFSESLFVHVDLSARRVVPFPPDVAEALDGMIARHSAAGWPDAGRRITPLSP